MTRFQYEVQYFHYSYFKQVAGSINVHGSIFVQKSKWWKSKRVISEEDWIGARVGGRKRTIQTP